MKVRNDFVTNSSSSSYIIAYKDVHSGSDMPIDRLNEMAQALLDNTDHYETECAEYFHSVKEIEDYFSDRYCDNTTIDDLLECWDNNQARYTREDVEKFFEDGYVIAVKDVSYHDELVRKMIDLLNETNDYFVLINNFE